jgi:hypothetical protein
MTVDHTFQNPFGQLVCCSIPKALREWKFSTRQDLGVYMGRIAGTSGGLAELHIEDTQLIEWFIQKSVASERITLLKTVEDAVTSCGPNQF